MVEAILREMRAVGNPAARESMARFGIHAENVIGLNIPQIRRIARRVGRHQQLAEELWATGIHDARILASLVGEPAKISRSVMDRWARDFASWDICDACCGNLFDRTPYAWQKVRKWARDPREFVRRAAFSTIAALAVHDKSAPDTVFLDALPLIEQYAFDNRNFVRKGVNWALRNIGKRNAQLLPHAIMCAERIQAQNMPAARWIAADALHELRSRRI
jgi:3-methyladenine DNA glycosylase AlkD